MAPASSSSLPQQDHFDRTPDSLVLIILNKLADVRSLGRCSAVSKRFAALVPLVHDVYVKIDRVVTADDPVAPTSSKPRSLFSSLLRAMLFLIARPLRLISGSRPVLPHHSPARVLKNFNHIRSLKIELPAGDVGTEDGVVLKWRAEFGSTLQNCVILGGTRMDRKPARACSCSCREPPSEDDNGSIPESFYTNGGLKLRVVWSISSLIAASTRHHLLRPVIEEHPTLKSLVLTDADGQGTLSMGVEQLREFREKPLMAVSATSNRTQLPASNMKLRYAPYLELPEGTRVQGATLVAIKPSAEGGAATGSSWKEGESFACGSFDGPFRAAVKALAKRRTYLLEMNGF